MITDLRGLADYVRARPLTVVAPALIGGIAISVEAEVPWITAAGAAVVIAGASSAARRGALMAAALVAVLAGFVRHELAESLPDSDISRASLPADRARVRGRVLEAPRFFGDRAASLDETHERHEDRIAGSFAMELASVEGLAGVTGRVRVQFYDREADLRGGEELQLTGRLRHPPGRRNPGGFDRRESLRRQGIGAILTVGAKDEWTLVAPAPSLTPTALVEDARSGLRSTLRRHTRSDSAAFLSALLFGTREDLPEDVVRSLQRSGTAHFLAVSGQNLAIILVLAAGLMTLLGLRGPGQHALLIGVLFLYAALSAWQVSVVRAFLMASVWLGARLVWRKSDSINSVCAAAAIIALVDPVQVLHPGFQLSFLAVLGILLIAPVFHDFLASAPSPDRRAWRWLGRQAKGVLAISMAAWLATAPVVLNTFNLVTPVILIANLLLVPVILLQTTLGLAILVLSPVVPPLADLLGALASLLMEGMVGISGILTAVPGSHFYLPPMPAWAVAGYYALLALWTAWSRLRPGGFRPWLCVAFAVALGVPLQERPRPEGLFVAMLDVGRGSATYVEWPDGRNLVFDCGSLNHRDAGAAVLAPYLWSRGIRRVDTLVLSHPDADHTNGSVSLVERFGIRQVLVSRRFQGPLLEELRALGVRIVELERTGAGPAVLGEGIEVLGPPTWEKFGADVAANEASIVLRLDGRVLLTGDIEERGTAELLEVKPDVRAEVLIVPHHGKLQKLHRELAEAVSPRVALVSAPEGYFAPQVVEELEKRCRVFRTGRAGAVEVTLKAGGPEVRAYLGAQTDPSR